MTTGGSTDAVCGGHGTCLGSGDNTASGAGVGQCACSGHFNGTDCLGCDDGYWGPQCSACPACVHGTCNGTGTTGGDGTCVCTAGGKYTGTLCDTCKFPWSSENGDCVCKTPHAGQSCDTCTYGHYGRDCSTCPSCVHGSCNGTGTNTGDGTCICHEGYSGPLCSECLPPWTSKNDNCVCALPYSGSNCDACSYNHYGSNCSLTVRVLRDRCACISPLSPPPLRSACRASMAPLSTAGRKRTTATVTVATCASAALQCMCCRDLTAAGGCPRYTGPTCNECSSTAISNNDDNDEFGGSITCYACPLSDQGVVCSDHGTCILPAGASAAICDCKLPWCVREHWLCELWSANTPGAPGTAPTAPCS